MTDYLTTSQVAKILNVSPQTVRRWEEEGKLTSSRTEGNHRRYLKDEVLALSQNSQAMNAKHISPPTKAQQNKEFGFDEGLEYLSTTSYMRWEQRMEQAQDQTEQCLAKASKATVIIQYSPRFELGAALMTTVVPIGLLALVVCFAIGFATGTTDTLTFRVLGGAIAGLMIPVFAVAGLLIMIGVGQYTSIEEENDDVEDLVQIAVPGRAWYSIVSQPLSDGQGSQAVVSISDPQIFWEPAEVPIQKSRPYFLCSVDLQDKAETVDTATISERFYTLCEAVKQMQQRSDDQRMEILRQHNLDPASFDDTLKSLQNVARQARYGVDQSLNKYAEEMFAA